MLAIRPALSNWLDAIRRSATTAPVASDPRVKRFEQPVPKVVRLPRHRDADGFEGAQLNQDKRQSLKGEARQNLQQSNARSATAQPRGGATDVTHFLRNDGFESATRKPVELTPKPPPSFKPSIFVFRFR